MVGTYWANEACHRSLAALSLHMNIASPLSTKLVLTKSSSRVAPLPAPPRRNRYAPGATRSSPNSSINASRSCADRVSQVST